MMVRLFRAHQERWIVAGILLVALAVRVLVARLPHVLQGDEGAYVWLGKTLLSGGGYQFFGKPELHYTPGYPVVAGLAWLVVRDLELASKICFVLFGTLTVVPVYLISRRVGGRSASLLAAALVAVSPALTSYVYFYGSMTEPLYFCLVFWGLYAVLITVEGGQWPAYLLAGLAFGGAYLTRPEGWVLLVLSVGYLVVQALGPQQGRGRRLAGVGVMTAAFLLISLPYLVYLRQHLGYWTLTGKTWVAYIQQLTLAEGKFQAFDEISWGLDSTGREVMYHSMEKFTHYSLLGEILRDPWSFLRHLLQDVRELDSIFLSKRVLPFFVLPLIGLGLFRTAWDRRRLKQEAYLGLIIAGTLASILVFTNHLRFLLGLLIIFLMWAAHGIVELGSWLGETVANLGHKAEASRRAQQWKQGAILAGGVLLCAYYLAVLPAAIQDGLSSQHFYYKEVGEWLKDNSPANARIMSRGAIVAIHAGRFWVPFPHASYEEVLRFARENQVDYLVVNQHEFELMRPELAFLSDPSQAPAELEAVLIHHSKQGLTVVYRLKGAS
ncbi:MAG: ArnT family glycosyltransferase [Anaerolineae bacterium]